MIDYKELRIGEEKINSQGIRMKIIKYNHAEDIDVLFENDDIIKNRTYDNFTNGRIKSLIYPNIYGVGCIGYGEYVGNINKVMTTEYSSWHGMLRRCYDEKWRIKQPTYMGCSVDKEWHNFQNFAKWFNENKWSKDCTCVDKDILNKGNKIYSSQNCILVDGRLNSLLLTGKAKRTELPIGVWYRKRINKYESGCSIIDESGKRFVKYLGYYDTPMEAFNTYKSFKEEYIRQVADEYKLKYPQLPQKLYDALYAYEVEITD